MAIGTAVEVGYSGRGTGPGGRTRRRVRRRRRDGSRTRDIANPRPRRRTEDSKTASFDTSRCGEPAAGAGELFNRDVLLPNEAASAHPSIGGFGKIGAPLSSGLAKLVVLVEHGIYSSGMVGMAFVPTNASAGPSPLNSLRIGVTISVRISIGERMLNSGSTKNQDRSFHSFSSLISSYTYFQRG